MTDSEWQMWSVFYFIADQMMDFTNRESIPPTLSEIAEKAGLEERIVRIRLGELSRLGLVVLRSYLIPPQYCMTDCGEECVDDRFHFLGRRWRIVDEFPRTYEGGIAEGIMAAIYTRNEY